MGTTTWEYQPPKVIANEVVEILWDRTAHTYKIVALNRPDLILTDKKNRKSYLIDIAVPGPHNMQKAVHQKIEKYKDLSMELEKQWNVKIKTLPIVITTTAVYPKMIIQNLLELGCSKAEIRAMHKATILHTTRIVRKVLGE